MVVVIAFLANLLVALAKTVAAVLTRSPSLLAEAAHSWADTGNEIFLLVADRRAARPRDDRHPLGFGREAYVWSLFAAFGLFTVGAVVSVARGVLELVHPSEAADFPIAYAVLAISFLVEGFSLVQSLLEARRKAREYRRTVVDYVLNGSHTTLRAVVAEDTAALIGLLVAGAGVGLHQLTGNAAWDAGGSILIGILLGVVAVVLIDRNRRYLIGATPPSRIRKAVGKDILAHREIQRVTYLHLEFVGPAELFLVAAVDLVGDAPEDEVARRLRRLSRELEKNELVKIAVLTLSVSDEPSLSFD
ncbi:MAG: cation diffusion facilitator family transporter [Labilithrix sp.]|nr:cation diffusion facilitator family transporter [Labilithrix sp.]